MILRQRVRDQYHEMARNYDRALQKARRGPKREIIKLEAEAKFQRLLKEMEL